MTTSDKGIELIKKWEGCRNKAYQCPSGVWTIGYGHTSGVTAGMECTEKAAEEWLREDVKKAETAVNSYMNKYAWSQPEFDALVSFTFNCGAGNLARLTANRTRTKEEIAENMTEYNKSNGKTLTGLVNRRKEEQAMFLSGFTTQECYPAYTGSSQRIDEVFSAIGARPDYDTSMHALWQQRKPIASANGIPFYTGTASQNMKLIKLASAGKLRRP